MLSDKKLFQLLKICLGSEHDCAKVAKAVSEVVVKIGAKNPVFETVKALLDRTAQLLIDTSAAKQLVTLVSKYVENENFDDEEDDDEGDEDVEADNSSQDEIGLKGRKALDLLLTCVTVFPTEFKFSLIYELTLQYLKRKDFVVDTALRILAQIGGGLLDVGSSVSSHFQKILTQLFTTGTPSQVKLAGRAINKIYSNSPAIFERVLKACIANIPNAFLLVKLDDIGRLDNELKSLRYESSRLVSTLSAFGQIALLEPSVFDPHNTTVIRDFVVKDLLVKDRSKPSKSPSMMWCDEGELSKEIKAKIQSIKLLVNWLCGLETKERNRVLPVLRMLDNVLKRDGDITSGGRIRNCEMSHMRLAAACAILKLAQDLECHEFIDFEFFLMLSSVMQDPCSNVRELFIKKLCRGLESFKLPLEYLTLFALSASESSKERKRQIKQMICRSINVRNEYLKQHPSGTVRPASVLPEYALPYLIYLLAHLPHIDYNKRECLREVKAYLWFFMEPVLARGDNYNFMKKLAENVKQTKDARAPDDEEANKAIYTVCDISIGIIMNLSKTHTFLLKDFPGNLVLPKKLFVPLAKGEGNNKSYLPKGFSVSPVKKTSTVPKVTPTKSTSSTKSSGSSNKKKSAVDKTVRRVSETSKTKTKKTQKALLDLLNKKTEGSDEDSDEEEDETPRKKGRSTRKETIPEPSSPETSPSPARKRPLSSPALASPKSPKEKRTRKATTTAIKEENPTRFSPRKNSKSSSGEENIVRNTRATDSFDQDVTVNVFSQSPAQDSSSQGSSKTKSPVKETTKRNKEPDPLDESEDMVSSKTRSPVKKQKTLEDQPAPLKQSSIIVKRKRKRK